MERLHSTAEIVRKVALLTLVGFLVVVLLGPVLSLVGVLLPFALVGFLVWLPFRLFVQRRQVNWSGLPRKVGQVVGGVLAIPFRILGFVASLARALLGFVAGLIGLAFRIVLPTLAGAFIFALLGAIGGATHDDADFRIPAAALIGGTIGLLYGVFRTREVRKVIVVRPAPVTAERA